MPSPTGNPIAAAAAVASCRIFEREPVFDRINRIAEIHRTRLAAIKGHPAVGDVRSIGTLAAIELRADDPGYASKLRPKLYKFFIDAGVLLRPLGNVVYIRPPYPISAAELNFIYDRIVESLALR
jgi:adenosylmethionine-8-amino-7-oxononanoate aminotransferase